MAPDLLLDVEGHLLVRDLSVVGEHAPGPTVDRERHRRRGPDEPPGVPALHVEAARRLHERRAVAVVDGPGRRRRRVAHLVEVDLGRPDRRDRPEHLVLVRTRAGDARADEVGAVGAAEVELPDPPGDPLPGRVLRRDEPDEAPRDDDVRRAPLALVVAHGDPLEGPPSLGQRRPTEVGGIGAVVAREGVGRRRRDAGGLRSVADPDGVLRAHDAPDDAARREEVRLRTARRRDDEQAHRDDRGTDRAESSRATSERTSWPGGCVAAKGHWCGVYDAAITQYRGT